VIPVLPKHVIAGAQIALSITFVGGYFFVLWAFMVGVVNTKPEWHDCLQTILGALTAALGTVVHFWFSRSRTEDPSGQKP
jgi:VIT1/CCC1 family predicted Fe2+/Mn2+ transporter